MSTGSAEQLKCMDARPDSPCKGDVEYRITPDRRDMRAFPRCEGHFERRLRDAEKNLELMSDVPPSWFDPTYVGESWDED